MKIPTVALRWGTALVAALVLAVAVGCTRQTGKVTFEMKNSHSKELAFNMDRGWQPNLFAYTGKPPRATPIILFAIHCTASCEAAEPLSMRRPGAGETESRSGANATASSRRRRRPTRSKPAGCA